MSWFTKKTADEQLFDAASSCDVKGVARALQRGANPNAKEPKEGQVALHLCLRSRKSHPQQLTPGMSVRHYRPVEDIKAIVDLLLKADANVNAADNDGVTPLHWAAGYCFTEIAQTLLQAGASLTAMDNVGMTPLHQAADSGCTSVAQLLIDAGADVNRRTTQRMTPLALAESKKALTGRGQDLFEPVRRLLRQHGGTS